MALFDVPGWSVPDDPVAVTPRKRKRTSKHDSHKKIQTATVNVEKVMEQLSARLGPAAENARGDITEGKNGGLSTSTEDDRPPRTKRRRAQGNKSQQSPIPSVQQLEPHKKSKKERPKKGPPAGDKVTGSRSTASSQHPTKSRSTLTSLQHDMKQSLDGARFRCVTHSQLLRS